MKHIFALALFIFSSLAMAGKGENVAFLIREPNHLKAAFLTLDQMGGEKFPIGYDRAVIVVCGGKGVSQLVKGGKFSEQLSKAKSKRTRVKACGLSLKRLKLDPKTLHPEVEVVENGLYEMIRLKVEGFISVDL